MEWFPDAEALRGRVAVVAGATRGAGRGIAAELVTHLGRTGIAAVVDHLKPDEVKRLAVDSGDLALVYGFTDLDGPRANVWRYIEETEQGVDPDPLDYR